MLEHADLSAQAGNNDAEDQDLNSRALGPGTDRGRAFRHFRAIRVATVVGTNDVAGRTEVLQNHEAENTVFTTAFLLKISRTDLRTLIHTATLGINLH